VTDNPVTAWIGQRRRKQAEWWHAVDAQHLEIVRQRENVSDEELIAREPAIPGAGHQMEMNRRLKAAIADLTGEVTTSRRSPDRLATRIVWLTFILVVLTVALVALTVILAIRE